jgi:hypothetical protein
VFRIEVLELPVCGKTAYLNSWLPISASLSGALGARKLEPKKNYEVQSTLPAVHIYTIYAISSTYSEMLIILPRVENPYLLLFIMLHPQLCSERLNHFCPHTYITIK